MVGNSSQEAPIPNSNPTFGLEQRGFDHIPEAERNMTLGQVDMFWIGSNLNLFTVALGSMAVALGLNLWLGLLACVIGNCLYLLLALGSVGTVRVGLPTTTLTRAMFGLRGNLPNAFLAWIISVAFAVMNTIFGVYAFLALFSVFGWSEPGTAGKLIAIVLQLLLSGSIAVLGHATMIYLQRIFTVALGAALLAVFAWTVDDIRWSFPAIAALSSSGSTIAIFLTAIGLVAAAPISFLYNGPDWVRYLPSQTPARAILKHVFLATAIPSIMVCAMGMVWATFTDMQDPVAGLRAFVPGPLFIVYILAVIGGSLANNIPTYYSSGLSLQAMGLHLRRPAATALDAILTTSLVLYVLFVQDFTTALGYLIALMVVWAGPYAGVWISDGFRKSWQLDHAAIHAVDNKTAPYWGWNGFNPIGLASLLAGMIAAILTMHAPFFEGPVARLMGHADTSWLAGPIVAALVHAILTSRRGHQSAATAPGGVSAPTDALPYTAS